MAANGVNLTGCWTCKIRKKRCDNGGPKCLTCKALGITCWQGRTKPKWMDGGHNQREMARMLTLQVKKSAIRRRGQQKIENIARSIDESGLPSEASLETSSLTILPGPSPLTSLDTVSNANNHHASPAEILLGLGTFTQPTTSQPREQNLSVLPVSHSSAVQSNHLQNGAILPKAYESAFIMAHLDYVFPVSYPFYRPALLEGGRSWLLNSILENKCLHHTIIALNSHFFSVVTVYEGAESSICGLYTQTALHTQTELALKRAQQDLQEVNTNEVPRDIIGSSRLMQSIVQLLIVEVLLGPNDNWQIHLDAATMLFQQLLDAQGDENRHSAFSTLIDRIGDSALWSPPDAPLWSPEQGAFRFYSALLIFNDIIASTSLEQAPKLQNWHPSVLENGNNSEIQPPLQLDTFIGCKNWALLAISQTAALAAWKKSMKNANKLSITELFQRATVIDNLLTEGLASLDDPNTQLDQHMPSNITQLDTLSCNPPCDPKTINGITKIWALSARSYLLTTLSGWQLSAADLRTNVAKTIDLLMTLSDSPTHVRTLAWPLCVTGCLANSNEEEVLRKLIADIGRIQAFGTIRQTQSIMEKVWSNRGQVDTEQWDIAACLGSLGHRVLLV